MSDLMIVNTALALEVELPNSRNPVMVYLSQYASDNSQRTLLRCLDTIAWLILYNRFPEKGERIKFASLGVDWSKLEYQHTQAIRAQLVRYYPRHTTVNQYIIALRGVLKETWRLGYISNETFARITDLKIVKGDIVTSGRDLESHEIKAILTTCLVDDSLAGIRDTAIVAVLTMGLRRAEVAALALANYTGNSLMVLKSKGNKDREVELPSDQCQLIDRWLAVRGQIDGALFLPIYGTKIQYDRDGVNQQTIYDIIKRRAVEAGIDDVKVHDFRRTFVGDLLDAGIDESTIMKFTGHSDSKTMHLYDRRGKRTLREAVLKLPSLLD